MRSDTPPRDRPGRVYRFLLGLAPQRWRDSIARDLVEEADLASKHGILRDAWMAWHLLRVVARLRFEAVRSLAQGTSPRVLGLDLRLPFRSLVRQPISSAAIVATLGLGIGASTAVYAVFNFALFRPAPGVGDPARAASVWITAPPNWGRGVETAHFEALRSVSAFEGVASQSPNEFPVTLPGEIDPQVRTVIDVTDGFFDVLHVTPIGGRLLNAEDHRPVSAAVCVISEHLWRTRFAAADSTVGSEVRIAGRPFTVVGIARAFRGTRAISRADIWVPDAATPGEGGRGRTYHQDIVARLRPGVSLTQAEAEARGALDAIGSLTTRDPGDETGLGRLVYRPVLVQGFRPPYDESGAEILRLSRMAMSGIAMLFVLASANAAGLLGARNARRRRETGLKRALGASRARVWRELMVEAAMLAMLSVSLGLLLAHGLTSLFRSDRLISYLPAMDDLALDWRVVLFACGAGAATLVVAALLPAVLAARQDPQVAIRESGRASTRPGRLRVALVAVQVALSLALGASAGVLGRTVHALSTQDLGFQTEGLLSFPLRPQNLGYDDPRTTDLFRTLQDRLLATPGVEGAAYGFSGHLDFLAIGQVRGSTTLTGDALIEVIERRVSAGYLETLGIPLVAGRSMTVSEAADAAARVVVIDEALARRLFGTPFVVGQSLSVHRPTAADGRRTVPHEIVGVAGSTRSRELRTGFRPTVYLPVAGIRIATFQVRLSLPPADAAATIRQEIRRLEPQLAGTALATPREQVEEFVAQERLLAKLGLVLSALALLIAVAGAATVVTYGVAERTREFGVRIALGASGRHITSAALGQVLRGSAIGIVAGLTVHAIGARWLTVALFDVDAFDPLTLLVCVVGLTLAILGATWMPVRRARRTDPAVALRAD